MPIMWTLDDATALIREIQPVAMEHGFNLSLGGGVLNHGSSMNDLDIVVCPAKRVHAPNLYQFLNLMIAKYKLVETGRKPWNDWMTLAMFKDNKGRRVELFIVNTEAKNGPA